jgi:hypothetical protein
MKPAWPPTWLRVRTISLGFGLALLGSCATQNSVQRVLPAETSFNHEAGRGGLIVVNIYLASGEALPIIVDTGAPFCVLDKSLEPRLGKPLRHYDLHSMFGTAPTQLYKSPPLFLGGGPLMTGDTVATMDCSQLSKSMNDSGHSNYRVMGVLGMECLRHYCLQLDFKNQKLSFMNSRQLDQHDLGEAFPLKLFHFPSYVEVQGNLAGNRNASSLVDTGMTFDGDVSLKPWEQQAFFQKYWQKDLIITNGIFGGYHYTNLCLGNGKANVLGLGLLSRNRVTFDFPKRTLYLKQQQIGPLN